MKSQGDRQLEQEQGNHKNPTSIDIFTVRGSRKPFARSIVTRKYMSSIVYSQGFQASVASTDCVAMVDWNEARSISSFTRKL
jgi:hypothetical protein